LKTIINENAPVNQAIMDKFVAMKDVLSLSCVVTDAQWRNNSMRETMRPRSVNKRVIGPALTVKLTPGDIVDCLVIFKLARPGDVVVIDAFGESETSIWGGLMSGLARSAGVVGAVIDGSCRDADEAKLLDFPVYSTHMSPRSAHTAISGRKEPIEINVPIVCGGVIVNPGDLIVADECGVVVAPSAELAEIYELAADLAAKEQMAREDILKGTTVEELLAKYGRI